MGERRRGLTCPSCLFFSYANHVTPIPKDMSLTDAAPILCAGVVRLAPFLIVDSAPSETECKMSPSLFPPQTVYKALKSAAIGTGETVVITGAGGGLGHLAVQYAHLMGYRVIGASPFSISHHSYPR